MSNNTSDMNHNYLFPLYLKISQNTISPIPRMHFNLLVGMEVFHFLCFFNSLKLMDSKSSFF